MRRNEQVRQVREERPVVRLKVQIGKQGSIVADLKQRDVEGRINAWKHFYPGCVITQEDIDE